MGIPLKDLDKVEAWKASTILDVGWHTVTVESAEEGTTSNGNAQVEFRFVSDDGDIRDWLVLTEATLGKAVQFLEAVGIEVQGGEWSFPTQQTVGKKLGIKVGQEPDNRDPSKMRRKVQAYVPVGNLPASSASSDGGGGTTASGDKLPF